MITDIVLSLALLGGVRDLLPNEVEEGLGVFVSSTLRYNTIGTYDDLMNFIESNPEALLSISEQLDLNADGVVDARELATMEMRGAFGIFDLTPEEAFTLAEGAVREDGDIGTSYVSEHDLKDWIVRGMWANLLRIGDTNNDGMLDSAEWAAIVSSFEAGFAEVVSAGATSAHDNLIVPDVFDFPEMDLDGAEALVAAGFVLGRKNVANFGNQLSARRRFGFIQFVAIAYVVTEYVVMELIEDSKKGHYIGCYVDDHHRDLDRYIGRGHDKDSCNKKCRGYKYFSLQDRDQCFCANSYATQSKYHKVNDSECNVYGRGLGGSWRNAVYERK